MSWSCAARFLPENLLNDIITHFTQCYETYIWYKSVNKGRNKKINKITPKYIHRFVWTLSYSRKWCSILRETVPLEICFLYCWCIRRYRQQVPPKCRYLPTTGASGCAVLGVDQGPLACLDRGFESRRGHGCLTVVIVVCCQVEVSATSCSLVQRSPTDCGASLCVI